MSDYNAFLERRRQQHSGHGFNPVWVPDWLFPFQSSLVEWATRMGRAAIFADCGLGKTPMQLVWAENVRRKTNRPVLILTPLAVSRQTEREGAKFGIEVTRSQDGQHSGGIVVTNYERLEHFDPDDFAGVVCDEGSILKNFSGKLRKQITRFMLRLEYRLICTATAAPNDYHELGTVSEALGCLGYRDMITRFFKEDTAKDYLGWGRKTYRFRGHAEEPFWKWVCSWARACRKPSDLGFDDDGFILPPLIETERVLATSKPLDGMLFAMPARDLREQRQERRETIASRCEAVAEVVAQHAKDEPDHAASVVWCHLNDEGDQLERMIPGAVQVKGSMATEAKEEALLAFQDGEIETLVTKPKIGCFGLNWQHCNSIVTFPSHSWEQYYQAVRRCLRFGQERPVHVTIVTTEGEQRVLANLQRKSEQAGRMFDSLTKHMNDALAIAASESFPDQEEVPSWL